MGINLKKIDGSVISFATVLSRRNRSLCVYETIIVHTLEFSEIHNIILCFQLFVTTSIPAIVEFVFSNSKNNLTTQLY